MPECIYLLRQKNVFIFVAHFHAIDLPEQAVKTLDRLIDQDADRTQRVVVGNEIVQQAVVNSGSCVISAPRITSE